MTWTGRLYLVLFIGTAMVIGALILVFGTFQREYDKVDSDFRDNVTWFIARLDLERVQLINAIESHYNHAADDAEFGRVADAHAAAVRQIAKADLGPPGAAILLLPDAGDTIRRTRDSLNMVETLLPRLELRDAQAHAEAIARLKALGPSIHDLELEAIAFSNRQNEYHRAFVIDTMWNTVGLFCGLALIAAAFVTLFHLEKRKVVHLRDDLEVRVLERTRELAAKNAELERANEGLRQFAFVASHDLQEPLRKIKIFASMIHAEIKDEASHDLRHAVQVIASSADRLRTLVADLLEYSRVTNKALAVATLDLDKIVRDVLQDISLQIAEADAVVTVDQLPQIEADALQVRQLFQNLISNAIKYRAADRRCMVELGAEEGADQATGGPITIYVKDNGIGFKQEKSRKIFEPFQRLHQSADYAGTGIGLAICARIAERHGWGLEAEGRSGEGATFRIKLPARGDAASRNPPQVIKAA